MALITVDILAKVVGYELSIKLMQAALSKVDPGSEMGKKITSALSLALKLVTALSKNMFPKASSDTLIDAIVEKANRAGESIREVANLMQNLTIKDLNLDALGSGFEGFKNELASLLNDLNSKLNAGLRDAILNSTTLSGVFNKLGTDLSKADANTLFTDLARGAKEARAETENAEKALEKINLKITNNELSTNALKLSNVSTLEGRLNLDAELKNITGLYDDFFTTLREKMRIGMESITLNTGIDSTKLLDSFFSGLTPDTVKLKIDELTANLSATGKGKREIYKAIFGEGTTEYRDFNAVINSLNLDGLLENVKAALTNFLEKIRNDIKPELHLQITRLIDNNSIDEATNQTISDLDKAYARIQSSLLKNAAELSTLMGQKTVAQTNLSAAQNNESTIEAVRAELQRQIDDALNLNKTLTDRIAQLEATIELIKSQAVGATKSAGENIKKESYNNTFPLEESEAYKALLAEITLKELALGKILGVILRWFSIYTVVRAVSNAIKSVISTLKELDATITEIAIVTSMNLDELWGLMGSYTDMAQLYAASISGVYKISQLYYQQGLLTAEVMQLTEQTLKMARISGLDYAQATDYMTNAVRSFKMEMSDALRVVDVYSAVAARSATDTTELASAMSKTASSAEAVGSSFESTTAMMAVMIEATRESAENIGSAMKSIISRYGEMTSDPSKLMDSEGEEMSLNRVDKALLTVGITIHDTAGKFRDFDDVIMELAAAWDTIDTNTQRYIATTMAGNRQQSRFLALVSSYERLNELTNVAEDSEDASQLQYLKTLDSIDAKTLQLLTSMQALYTDTGIESFYKGLLDVANNIIITFNRMPTVFNLPVVALATLGALFWNIASVVTNVFAYIKANFATKTEQIRQQMLEAEMRYNNQEILETLRTENAKQLIRLNAANTTTATLYSGTPRGYASAVKNEGFVNGTQIFGQLHSGIAMGLQTAGAIGSMLVSSISEATDGLRLMKGGLTGLTGLASAFGMAMSGNWIGAVLMAVTSIVNAVNTIFETAEERAERLEKAAEEANNKRIKATSEYKDLKSSIKTIEELAEARYDSAEAAEAYFEASAKIAELTPELVSSYDAEGNAVINLLAAYDKLADSRNKAAEAGEDSSRASLKNAENSTLEAAKTYGLTVIDYASGVYLEDNELQNNKYKAATINTSYMGLATEAFSLANIQDTEGTKYLYQFLDNLAHPEGKLYELGGLFTLDLAQQYIRDEVKNTLDSDLIEVVNYLLDHLYGDLKNEDLVTAGIDLNRKRGTYSNLETSAITSRVASLTLNELDEKTIFSNYLNEFSGATELLNSTLLNAFNGQTEILNVNDWLDSEGAQLFKNTSQILSDWWLSLSPDELKVKNALFRDIGKYDVNSWIDAFETNDNELLSILQQYYANHVYSLESFKKAINTRIASAKEKTEYTSANKIKLDLVLGGKEYLLLLNITDAIDKRVLAGGINTKTGNQIIKQFLTNVEKAPEEILDILFSTDLFSFSSIEDSLTQLRGMELTEEVKNAISGLETIMKLIPTNINTEVLTLLKMFSDLTEDFDKIIKSATSGMDFKAATELATKLGKSVSDFDLREGKYYFNDLLAIKEAYIKENTLYIKDFNSNLESRYDVIKLLNTPEINGEELLLGKYTVEDLSKVFSDEKGKKLFLEKTNIEYDQFISYYTDFLALIKTGISDFLEYMISQMAGIEADMANYLSSSMASTALNSGDIQGFMQATGTWQSEDVESYRKYDLKKILSISQKTINVSTEKSLVDLATGQNVREVTLGALAKLASVLELIDGHFNDALDSLLEIVKTYEEYYEETKQEWESNGLVSSEALEAEKARITNDLINASRQNQKTIVEISKMQDIVREVPLETLPEVNFDDFYGEAEAYAKQFPLFDLSLEEEEQEFQKILIEKQIELYNLALEAASSIPMVTEVVDTILTKDQKTITFKEFEQAAFDAVSKFKPALDHDTEEFKALVQTRLQELYDEAVNSILLETGAVVIESIGIANEVYDVEALALANLNASGTYDISNLEQVALGKLEAALLHNAKLILLKKNTSKKDYAAQAEQFFGNSKYTPEQFDAKVEELIIEDLLATGKWASESIETYIEEVTNELEAQLQALAAKEANELLLTNIAFGKLDELPEALNEWRAAIYKTFTSAANSTFSSMETALKGGSNKIEITEDNAAFLEQLGNKGWLKNASKVMKKRARTNAAGRQLYDSRGYALYDEVEDYNIGDLAEWDIEALKQIKDDEYIAFIESLGYDQEEKQKRIEEFLNIKYPDVTSAVTGMADKTSVTATEFETYLTKVGKTPANNAEFKKLVEAYHLLWNAASNTYDVIEEKYAEYILMLRDDVIAKTQDSATSPEAIAAQIKLDAAQRTHANKDDSAVRKAFQDVISNYSSVTDEQYTALLTALGKNWEQVAKYFTKDGSTYNLDVSAVRTAIEGKVGNMSEDTQTFLLGLLTSIVDNGLKSISTGVSLVTSGTTSQSEMLNFLVAYNERVGDTAKISTLYDYNNILDAWTLKPEALQKFVEALGLYLVLEGLLKQEELDAYIEGNVNKKIAENIDFSSFMDAENRAEGSDAYKKLYNSLHTYYDSITELVAEPIDFLTFMLLMRLDNPSIGIAVILLKYNEMLEAAAKNREEIINSQTQSTIDAIEQGGFAAVEALLTLAEALGVELSADDIEKAYKLLFNKLSDAMSTLEDILVGDVVSKEVAGVLRLISGFTINADGIVIAVGDLIEAYENIYNQIKNNAISTTNDINKAYAKLLTARNRDNVNALETLENAAGMTYEAFGDMLSLYNIRLEDALSHADRFGIQDTGFGKIRVTDFNALASRMGWNIDSPEYAEAYNSWVDSMAELANLPATFMQSAADLLKGLTEAKPNLAINVSYLDKLLNGTLEDIVTSYGALLHNGLLTITETTDLPALILAISQLAAATGAMIPELLAEVADAVEGLLDLIISLIKGGISGSMSNVDAVNLSKWANDNGIGAIQFTETNEGLKLTLQSLALIYNQLKKIDAILAQGLLPEILKSSNNYGSFNKVLTEYNEVNKLISNNLKLDYITSNLDKTLSTHAKGSKAKVTETGVGVESGKNITSTIIGTDEKTGKSVILGLSVNENERFSVKNAKNIATALASGKATVDELNVSEFYLGLYDTEEEAIAVADQIDNVNNKLSDPAGERQISNNTAALAAEKAMLSDLIAEMMTTPDSFNFMSGSLPDSMLSIKNVYENAYEALDVIKSSKSSGYMDLLDFYNIVTTASNYLEAAGKEFNIKGMNAAELIEAAGKELVTVDGTLSVDLTSSGLNILGSLDEMSSGLTSGINELADAEVAMLDAEIKVMEVLAAMEKIGDVDVDGNGINFEIGDIFLSDGPEGFTQDFKDWTTDLKEASAASEDLKTALQSWIINGTSFYDLLDAGSETWIKAFGSMDNVSKFLQNFDTTDWEIGDNLQLLVKDFITTLGVDQTINLDNGAVSITVGGNLISLSWSDEAKLNAAEQAVLKLLKDGNDLPWEGKDINEKLTNLLNSYTQGELTFEQEINARTVLGIATGEIEIKDNGTKVDKNQRYSGTYAGVKFTGQTKSEVEKKIGEALVYTDAGFQFTYEDGQVLGTLSVGSTDVTITGKGNGKFTAKFGGELKEFKNLNEALAWLASKGVGGKAGETYDYQGLDYTIKVDSSTGFTYSYTKTPEGEDKWIYNGTPYDSEELAKLAMLADSLTVKDKNGKVKNVKDEDGYKVISTGDLLKIHHVEDGEDQYEFNGKTGLTREQYEALVKAYRRGSGTDDDVIKDDKGNAIGYTYYEGGQKLSVVLTEDGIEYSFECQGYTFRATSEDGIKLALADYNWVTGGETPPGNDNGKSYTIEVGGKKVQITYTDDGVVIEGLDNGEIPEEILTQFTEKYGEGVLVDGKLVFNTTGTELAKTEDGTLPSEEIPVTPEKSETFDSTVTGMKSDISNDPPTIKPAIDVEDATTGIKLFKGYIENLKPTMTINASGTAEKVVNGIKSALEEMASKTYEINVRAKLDSGDESDAKGNVALASGNQKTLMGELGPELVVSNGRYFVVGQSGAEMVDLPKDAIVFNHQQTASLLANGRSGRGKAVTNETNAVSFAKGNTQGPAMASASAALATLKQLKAMWESLLDASVKDLAGKAGGGGGGGGGSSDSSSRKSWVEDVERWYNLMLKIAQLETDITLQETLRTKLNSDFKKNGKAYYESLKATLDMIDLQLIAQNELNISRQAYFAKRLGQLNKSGAFKDLYEFDENGQLKYKDFKKAKKVSFTDSEGKTITNTYKNGFEFLSDLTARNDNGESKYTVEQQYELLKAMGYGDLMKYDSSGNEITKEKDDDGNEKEDQSTFYTNSVQAVWDLIESQKTEMLDLHDTIEDGQNKMNELMNDRNEILKEIRDNQMSVELDVLNAIIDSRQRLIDDLQDQRDALEDSTSKYIQGLTDLLNAERQMYENQESLNDLDTKRRKLAVLLRSGGSNSEIASLQDEIRSAELDMYFDKFQEQIDAIQAASDKEIERLDAQIDLMTETLEYQKENGLLWESVYEVMNGKSGAGIALFIMDQNSEYWGNSPLKKTEDLEGLLFKSEQWTAFRDDLKLSRTETKKALQDNKVTTSDIHSAVYGTDSDTEWKMMNKSMTDLYGPNWNKTAKNIGEKFEKQYATSGDITAAANAVIENKKIQKQIGEKTTGKKSDSDKNKKTNSTITGGNGTKSDKNAATSEWSKKGNYITFTDDKGKVVTRNIKKLTKEEKEKYGLTGFSEGGLARFTGLALLDGTPAKPEAVLTLKQTDILRNDILGNNHNSLLNLLVDFRSVVSGINAAAAYTGASNDNSVAIQNASVNMYVDSIDNNYGAQLAGDKVMEEILRIARKSGANNSVGR